MTVDNFTETFNEFVKNGLFNVESHNSHNSDDNINITPMATLDLQTVLINFHKRKGNS